MATSSQSSLSAQNADAPIITITHALTPEHVKFFRILASELIDSYGFDLSFQNVAEELATLPGEYAAPEGALVLAFVNGMAAGCVGMRPLGDGICEMKRLYVRPDFRKHHIGRILCQELIETAKKIGYKAMRLDTRREMMQAAITLYESLGFYEIPPYNDNPFHDIYYMECQL
jgi:ribosomal protein S18 acetylase RimI-like enzyme